MAAKDVDAAARRVIEAAGWGEQFPHGTGHGVGLDIHEAPHVARTSAATLARSSVVTVEPGVYLPGVGGVRTEDTVVVCRGGCPSAHQVPQVAQPLSHAVHPTTAPADRKPAVRSAREVPHVPMITTNDLKNGMTLNLDEGLFNIVEFQHVKPGKGGAFVRTTLKNARTGQVIDRTFRAGEKVDRATLNKREMQFLYREADDYVFMDNTSYEQLNVGPAALGAAAGYLVESMSAVLVMFEDEIIDVELPAAVELAVAETEPGVQGDRVSGARKPATPGDRQGHPGAAVRGHRRPHQGRHPLGRLPDPGLRGSAAVPSAGASTRRQARERALGLLYEAESKGQSARAVVDAQPAPPDPFAVDVAVGVAEHASEIDGLIRRFSRGWTLERMPVVDRLLLQMGSYELLHRPDVPVPAVISEAVELAKRFSTDDSSRFVNGVLARIAEEVRDGRPRPGGPPPAES